jgi:hypothetical protein
MWRRRRCAIADIEYATRARDDVVTDAQIAVTESDLPADTRDIGPRLQPIAGAGDAIEVNR